MRKVKDPQAVLDYKFDWQPDANPWLAVGETITTRTVTVPAGLTKNSDTLTDSATSVTAWLSGGTTGVDYSVTCHIVTSQGREDDRTMIIVVRHR